MAATYRHTGDKMHHLRYSILWATRRLRGVIAGEVAQRFEQLVREIAAVGDLGCEVLEVSPSPGGEYVMISLVAPPSLAPDQIVFRLRRATAHALREEFSGLRTMPSLWTRGYVVECGTSIEPETIREYLTEQEERKS